MVCRRYPPTSHLVGSRTIGMDIQPLFQSVFPIVNGDFVCDEHKLKVSAMAVDGNVTTLQPQERE